jgi:hypothetical protein
MGGLMARLRDIVVDCHHPASLARFWVAVLDGYAVAPYDEDELARMRAKGIDGPEDDPTVLVEGGPGQVRYWFTQVPEPRTVKNRVHLDLAAADPEAELARLVALGARVLGDFPDWTTLADIEGNEFCLLKEGMASTVVVPAAGEPLQSATVIDCVSALPSAYPMVSAPVTGPLWVVATRFRAECDPCGSTSD